MNRIRKDEGVWCIRPWVSGMGLSIRENDFENDDKIGGIEIKVRGDLEIMAVLKCMNVE